MLLLLFLPEGAPLQPSTTRGKRPAMHWSRRSNQGQERMAIEEYMRRIRLNRLGPDVVPPWVRSCSDLRNVVTCTTVGGNVPNGTACTFPFVYRGRTFKNCTTLNHDGLPWCSTSAVFTGAWGECAACKRADNGHLRLEGDQRIANAETKARGVPLHCDLTLPGLAPARGNAKDPDILDRPSITRRTYVGGAVHLLPFMTYFDENADGTVVRATEYTEARAKLYFKINSVLTRWFWQELDRNQDGRTDQQELALAANVTAPAHIQAWARQWHAQADTDGNGKLSRTEYIASRSGGTDMTFDRLNTNGCGSGCSGAAPRTPGTSCRGCDKTLTAVEYLQGVQELFARKIVAPYKAPSRCRDFFSPNNQRYLMKNHPLGSASNNVTHHLRATACHLCLCMCPADLTKPAKSYFLHI